MDTRNIDIVREELRNKLCGFHFFSLNAIHLDISGELEKELRNKLLLACLDFTNEDERNSNTLKSTKIIIRILEEIWRKMSRF